MIRSVVPFRRWHYDWLLEQGPSADYGALTLTRGTLALLETHNTWTAVVGAQPLAIAGTFQLWPGRHMAWAHLSAATGRYMGWITAETRQRLALVPGRVELTVRADFAAGLRWAQIIGFQVETPLMRGYGPQGEDHVGYVRMN